MERVVLLNNDYSFLTFINWKKAVKLIYKGKCEVVETTKRVVNNFEKTVSIVVPKVLRLLNYIMINRKNVVKFSRTNIYIRDKYTCVYCNNKNKKNLTIDHVIPRSKGGKDSFENCVTSCESCNMKKGNRTPEEAGMRLRTTPKTPSINEFIRLKTISIPT